MKKRTVFFDLRYLSYLTCGFGQLSLYYGDYFLHNPDKYEDLDITLFVPEEYVGKFGDKVKYLKVSKIYKFFPFLLPKYDITHSITQQIKYTRLGNKTFRILTIHDLNYLYQRNNPRKVERKHKQVQARIDLADLVMVISKFTAEDIEKHFGVLKVPVVLNYNGLKDITKDHDEKPDFIKSEDRKFFFSVGEIAEKKNFHVLLDLMKLMPEYDLYICGNSNNSYGQKIEGRIKEENIGNVFLTGRISHEEKVWMYRNCFAFLFPSKFEGFGIPVIDAMRFDKPVFSSDMTSLKEIGDRYAFFWKNFEPEHMKQVIDDNLNAFYNDSEFRKNQVEYAFTYTMERHMENFFNMYRTANLRNKSSISKTLRNYLNFIKA